MKRPLLLVTGAAGFTGKYLIEAASRKGYRCVGLVQCSKNSLELEETVTVDLLEPLRVEEIIQRFKPDYIVHLAAISFVGHGNISEIYQVNQIGTINLLEAVEKYHPNIEKIILASSANIYGNAKDLPITELTTPFPVNHYAMSKYVMELSIRLYPKLPTVIVRPFNYTGFGQSENFLVPKIVRAFRDRQESIELGNLNISRDFCDVRDVVNAYLRLLDRGITSSIYNICSGTPIELTKVVAMLNEMAGYKIEISVNPDLIRLNEIETLYGSPQYLESCIGNYRKFSMKQTLNWMLGGSE